MARKCIYQTIPTFGRTVKVYIDSQWDELVCRLYINGNLYAPADYHSPYYKHDSKAMQADNIADAIQSANAMTNPLHGTDPRQAQ